MPSQGEKSTGNASNKTKREEIMDVELPWFVRDILQDDRVQALIKDAKWPIYKYSFLILLKLYLIFGYGAQLLCNLIGFVYPAYCSIKALESNHKEDDTRWLTYWVVFAVFSVFEFFSDILLSWFPLYWLAKCMFLTWCFLPISWNGSDVIYTKVIRPFFMKHQTGIDSAMNKVTDKLGDLADSAAQAALKTQ